MDKVAKTLISGFTGTSFMTAASALMSLLPNEDFKEPKHLSTMAGRLAPFLSKTNQNLVGWSAHYAAGFLFAATYVELWESRKIKRSIKNGIILGALSGLMGMLIWKGTFKVHPLPPNIRYLDFYLQRIPAHIVFAVFTTIAYRMIKDKEGQKAEINLQGSASNRRLSHGGNNQIIM